MKTFTTQMSYEMWHLHKLNPDLDDGDLLRMAESNGAQFEILDDPDDLTPDHIRRVIDHLNKPLMDMNGVYTHEWHK